MAEQEHMNFVCLDGADANTGRDVASRRDNLQCRFFIGTTVMDQKWREIRRELHQEGTRFVLLIVFRKVLHVMLSWLSALHKACQYLE